MADFGDGMIAFAIAFTIVGFVFCVTTIDNTETNYETCLRKCPASNWDSTFEGLECPKMCAELIDEDANCTEQEQGE